MLRRFATILTTFAVCLACTSESDDPANSDDPEASVQPTLVPVPRPEPTLPAAGRSVVPEYRLVGLVGGRSPAFGRLEPGTFDEGMRRIKSLAKKYDNDGKKIMPVFELVAIIAHGSPADGGMYRTVEPDAVIDEYFRAARKHGAMLLLNVQPGRADFLPEVKKLKKWLVEPDVGLALDPEWAVGPDAVPGGVYGSTTGEELNQVARYLASLVKKHNLPDKVMVYHQVHDSVVDDESDLRAHDGVVAIKSVDGIGARRDKEETWDRLMPPDAKHIRAGFKLFYDEDAELGPLMTPGQVLRLKPRPVYVMYE